MTCTAAVTKTTTRNRRSVASLPSLLLPILICLTSVNIGRVACYEDESEIKFVDVSTVQGILALMDMSHAGVSEQRENMLTAEQTQDKLGNIQQIIGEDTGMSTNEAALFETIPEAMGPTNPVLEVLKGASDPQFMPIILPLLDHALLTIGRLYLIYMCRKSAGKKCYSIEAHSFSIWDSALKFKQRTDPSTEMLDTHTEVMIAEGTEEKAVNVRACSTISFWAISVIVGLLAMVGVGFYVVSSATPVDLASIGHMNEGIDSITLKISTFGDKLEQKLNTRNLRLLTKNRDFVKQLSDPQMAANGLVVPAAVDLQHMRSSMCSLSFLEPVMDTGFGVRGLLKSNDTMLEALDHVLSEEHIEEMNQLLSTIKESIVPRDDETEAFMSFIESKTNKHRKKVKPAGYAAKKARQYVEKVQFDFDSLNDGRDRLAQEMKSFTNDVTGLFQGKRYDQLRQWCTKTDFVMSQEELRQTYEKRMKLLQEIYNEILGKVDKYLDIPFESVRQTANRVGKRYQSHTSTMTWYLVCLSLCIGYYVLSGVVVSIGPYVVVKALNITVGQIYLDLCTGMCTNWIIVMEVGCTATRFVIIGSLIMTQQLYKAEYAWWIPVKDEFGDFLANSKTNGLLVDLLGAENELFPLGQITFNQAREQCSTAGHFNVDLDQLDLFKIYKARTARQVHTQGKSAGAYHDQKVVAEFKQLGTKQPVADDAKFVAQIKELQTLHKHLTELDRHSVKEFGQLFSPTDAGKAAAAVSMLKYRIEQVIEVIARIEESFQAWNNFHGVVTGQGAEDIFQLKSHIEAHIDTTVRQLSQQLTTELTEVTLECRSIFNAVDNIARQIKQSFNMFHMMFEMMNRAFFFISLMYYAVVMQSFIGSIVCASKIIKAVMPISMARYQNIVYGHFTI